MIVNQLYNKEELEEYQEYCKVCESNNIEPLSIMDWIEDYQTILKY